MDQALAIRIIKKISSRTAKMKLSGKQFFVLSHNRFDIPIMNSGTPAYIDRYSIFISREKNAKTNTYVGWLISYAGSVARGLSPSPQGAIAQVGTSVTGLLEKGQMRPSAVANQWGDAYSAGLKMWRPLEEGAENQFTLNSQRMHAHMAAKDIGLFALIESDGNIVRFGATDDFRQFAVWRQNLDKRDFMKDLAQMQTFQLGEANGEATLKINGQDVYLWVKEHIDGNLYHM